MLTREEAKVSNEEKFDSLISYIRQMDRNTSTRKVCDLEEIARTSFSKAKNDFSLNLKNMIKFCNTEKGKSRRLIFDYVLISHDMRIIDKPYNLIYNYVLKHQCPTLVLLFAILEIDGKVYPLGFDYWIQKVMLDSEEDYFSKTEIAQKLFDKIIKHKLKFNYISFDAGFCSPKFLKHIDNNHYIYFCRFPKSRKFKVGDEEYTAKSIYAEAEKGYYLHGSFYFDTVYGFTKPVFCEYKDMKVQLVLVANSKEKLINRDFYCIITNDLDLKYTKVIRIYMKRSTIEFFLKI